MQAAGQMLPLHLVPIDLAPADTLMYDRLEGGWVPSRLPATSDVAENVTFVGPSFPLIAKIPTFALCHNPSNNILHKGTIYLPTNLPNSAYEIGYPGRLASS